FHVTGVQTCALPISAGTVHSKVPSLSVDAATVSTTSPPSSSSMRRSPATLSLQVIVAVSPRTSVSPPFGLDRATNDGSGSVPPGAGVNQSTPAASVVNVCDPTPRTTATSTASPAGSAETA